MQTRSFTKLMSTSAVVLVLMSGGVHAETANLEMRTPVSKDVESTANSIATIMTNGSVEINSHLKKAIGYQEKLVACRAEVSARTNTGEREAALVGCHVSTEAGMELAYIGTAASLRDMSGKVTVKANQFRNISRGYNSKLRAIEQSQQLLAENRRVLQKTLAAFHKGNKDRLGKLPRKQREQLHDLRVQMARNAKQNAHQEWLHNARVGTQSKLLAEAEQLDEYSFDLKQASDTFNAQAEDSRMYIEKVSIVSPHGLGADGAKIRGLAAILSALMGKIPQFSDTGERPLPDQGGTSSPLGLKLTQPGVSDVDWLKEMITGKNADG